MRKFLSVLLGIFLLSSFSCAYAQTETVAFMHKTFDVKLPDNYCRVPADDRLFRLHQRAYGKSVKLGFIAAKCDAVRDLVEGRSKSLSHFIAVEQIGIDRKFVKFGFGSWAYVTLITAFKPNFAKLEKRLKDKLEDEYQTTITNINYAPVSKNNKSVLFEATGTINDSERSVNVHVYAFTKLAYSIPLAIHVYDENLSEGQLRDSLKELAEAIKAIM